MNLLNDIFNTSQGDHPTRGANDDSNELSAGAQILLYIGLIYLFAALCYIYSLS